MTSRINMRALIASNSWSSFREGGWRMVVRGGGLINERLVDGGLDWLMVDWCGACSGDVCELCVNRVYCVRIVCIVCELCEMCVLYVNCV